MFDQIKIRQRGPRARSLLVARLLCSFSSLSTAAQENKVEQQPTSRNARSEPTGSPAPSEHGADKNQSQHRGALVIAPLPIPSPALGSGIVPVIFYIFPLSTRDKTSSASLIGAAGLEWQPRLGPRR